jgi:N-acetylglucosaminyldiphosphoundecaprenol N-acetyl-beta-D-mannosaminyltransferase
MPARRDPPHCCRTHPPENRRCLFPPFRPLSNEEENDIINRINESAANLVFVALGCPKQELWMARHKGKINAVMLGLGGAFPVYAGAKAGAALGVRSEE